MKKHKIIKLGLDLYEETLDNGLKIFVVPDTNVKNVYATLSTNYGSVQRKFVPLGKNEMVEVPDGVAHFLEHKMFEQKDGKDPFAFYSEHGADANANTTNFKTTYLFTGTKYFEENLDYLLDYVYSPYFTDENVEKEKGIIIEEMRMYEDDPYSVIYEKMTYNMFKKHPIKIPVIGNYESINSITKEDLYTCYNTFYHPGNMFLVVTGNVKANNVINIVKKNMSKRKFDPFKKIALPEYDEPNEVSKKSEISYMNVNIPKVGIGIKIDISNVKMEPSFVKSYLGLYFDIKTDNTSILNEELKDKNIINDGLYTSVMLVDNYICVYILGETKKTKTLIDTVLASINDKKINQKDFSRKINASIASLIGASDNIYAINNKVMTDVIRNSKVELDVYNRIKNMNYKDMKKVLSKISFDNYLTYIIKPKRG